MPTRAGGKRCAAVTAELGRRIVSGTFGPGDTLPTEANLCDLFGVSRTTVREAVKRLHGKGLIAVSPRSGTKVLPTLHWNQFDAELLGWRVDAGMNSDMLDQLYGAVPTGSPMTGRGTGPGPRWRSTRCCASTASAGG